MFEFRESDLYVDSAHARWTGRDLIAKFEMWAGIEREIVGDMPG